MKEYKTEKGKLVNLKQLEAEQMSLEGYQEAHKGLPILCHDVMIKYGGGILLVRRKNLPAKDILWPIGGRVSRGVDIEDSLKEKVRKESGLEIDNIKVLGHARTYFKTDPFQHGRGTDTINFMFIAEGRGELILDALHEEPTIITKEKYNKYRDALHPYVRDFLDKAIELL